MGGIFAESQAFVRDVFETSQRCYGIYIFFEIRSRLLKKTSFLRCFWKALKTSQKRHSFWYVFETSLKSCLFWDVSERSLRCLSQWGSDWDFSETSNASWVEILNYIFKCLVSPDCLHPKTPYLDDIDVKREGFNRYLYLKCNNCNFSRHFCSSKTVEVNSKLEQNDLTLMFAWFMVCDQLEEVTLTRSSRSELFCLKGILKNFAEFKRKHLCWILFFDKVEGLRPVTLLK